MKFTNLLIAFATGDALGIPVEFNSRDTMMHSYIDDMVEYGTHYQPIGTWSNDTSMTIATMDSINNHYRIDYNDIMNNFVKWYRNNKYTATDRCFDIGGTCSSVILNFTGNIAGIIYDNDTIPKKWKSNLEKIDYLLELSSEYEKVLMEEN